MLLQLFTQFAHRLVSPNSQICCFPGKHPFPSYFPALLPTESEAESKAGDEGERPLAGREGLVYKMEFLTLPRLDSPSSLLDHLEEKRKTGMSLDYFLEASPPVVNKPSSR